MSQQGPRYPELKLSPGRIGELVKLADASASTVSSWHEISSSLKSAEDSNEAAALAMAFDYIQRRTEKANGRDTFGPMWEIDNECYPMPVTELPEKVLSLWEGVASSSQTPAIRARLYDLLFIAGRLPKHTNGESACRSYLELSRREWEDLYRAEALIRALDIARQLKNETLAQNAVTNIVDNAQRSLDASEHQPGVALRLISRLLEERDPPTSVDDLLINARGRYRSDPFIESEVAAMQRKRLLARQEDTVRIDREIASIWINAAESAEHGLVRSSHLTSAIEYARDHNQGNRLADLIKKATLMLQDIDPDDLGLQKISTSYNLTDEQVNSWTEYYAGHDDLRTCLTVFAQGENGTPPTGNVDDNRTQVEQLAVDAPLYSMLRSVIVGGDGLPRWTPQSEQDHEEQKLTSCETFRLKFIAPLYAHALAEIGKRHNPSRDHLVKVLSELLFPPAATARTLADALLRYWQGDYEGCAYILTAKIEAIARNLSRSLDEPVYSLQRKKSPGKYVGLPSLFRILRDRGMDESWYRHLQTLLCSMPGLNYRNELAHGFVDEVQQPTAALLIQAALYLAMLGPAPAEQAPEPGGPSEGGE